MPNTPNCPKCNSDTAYQDAMLYICPMCNHEWSAQAQDVDEPNGSDDSQIKDAHGTVLVDGDTITLIKELKIKGSNSSIKVGTKVKNIKLNPDSSDGHDINCKIPGFGSMGLKSEFVKKAN